MSVYTTLDGRPHTALGMGSPKEAEHGQAKEDSAAEVEMRERAFARKRRLAPANDPLPTTFKWLAKLPRSVQPLALFRRYPRIANLMAGAWDDPMSFRPYLDDLLTDRRGNRKGFPREMLRELLALRLYYENLRPPILDTYEKVGKRD
jgi:hypothetical protein